MTKQELIKILKITDQDILMNRKRVIEKLMSFLSISDAILLSEIDDPDTQLNFLFDKAIK